MHGQDLGTGQEESPSVGDSGADMAHTVSEIVVTEDISGEPLEELARSHRVRRCPDAWQDRAQLRGLLGQARAVVIRNRTVIDGELLAAAPRLEVIGRAGVGFDNVDVSAADARGVVVVVPRGANAASVAEHTLALALGLSRQITEHDRAVRAGGWVRTPGRELSGRTWALLGAGATGRAVARLAAALGMRVLAHDPYVDPVAAAAAGIELVPLDALLASADVLSVHLPSTAQTRHLLREGTLGLLRPGCLLVNVGRGETLDEEALARALRSGHIAGAALDVRAQEPPGPGPLDGMPNLIFTPHVAGITQESQQRILAVLAGDITNVLAGKAAAHAVGLHRHAPRSQS